MYYKTPTPKHIISKIQKPGNQEKMLQVSREGGKQTKKPINKGSVTGMG